MPDDIHGMEEAARRFLAEIDKCRDASGQRNLITLKEAAFRYRKHDTTVRRWAKEGRLGELRGGQWMLDVDLVERRGRQ